jgi:hypothetical protein
MLILTADLTKPMSENFWVSLADKGLTIAFLAAAVYFMGKWFLSAQQAKDSLYAQRIAEMGNELTQLRDRVRSTEIKIAECETDRADLRRRVECMQGGAK